MKKKQDEYHVTIGYKAVITMVVRAESEAEARKIAESQFKQDRFRCKNLVLEDDNWKVDGAVNYSRTWAQL